MNPLKSLADSYQLLTVDFTGITLHPFGATKFFLNCFIVGGIIGIYYLFGDKMRRLFFKESAEYSPYINIVLSYILVGTLIGILGFFSLLNPMILDSFYLLVILIAIFPINLNKKRITDAFIKYSKLAKLKKWSFVKSIVLFFILLSFIRLSIPEIEEDTYHTDMPVFYLSQHTTMLETRDPLHVIPFPQLAEMNYIFPVMIGEKDSARFLHFSFYLLIILLLFTYSSKKEHSFARYAPLLFISAPVVLRYARAQYIDFYMVFCFLLSIILLQRKGTLKNCLLAGGIFGAALATKNWVLVYIPAILMYIIYLNRSAGIPDLLKKILIFFTSSFAVVGMWYLRSYLISGYPLFPIFSQVIDFDSGKIISGYSSSSFGFNTPMFALENLIVLSPLFFLAFIYCIFVFKNLYIKIKQTPLLVFILFMTVVQLLVRIGYGRYLLVWYTCFTIIVSAGIALLIAKWKTAEYTFITGSMALSLYYIISSIFLLPYGFGWADQNKFLTRIEERNNNSYYDFNHLFDKEITKNDFVGIYGVYYYYYADFHYVDARYALSKTDRSFDQLRTYGITKLFIKDGDLRTFCAKLQLKHCQPQTAQLLASYRPNSSKVYNLYSLNWSKNEK